MTLEERIQAFKDFMKDTRVNAGPLAAELNLMGFFTAPASTRFHGAYEGGLFDHSLAVAKKIVEISEKMDLKWDSPDSPKVVGILHDICKCDLYERSEDGWKYCQNTIIAGHGDKSVIMAQLLNHGPYLTEEEALCIRYHMGAYEGEGMWKNFGAAIGRYENILWTHTADMWVSKVLRL